MAPVHLTSFNADVLEPQTSLDVEEVGNGQGSVTKPTMNITRATDATVDVVTEIDMIFDLDVAKLDYGKSSDLMVILYLNSYDALSEADLRTIVASIPHIVHFRPLEARSNESCWIWSGSNHIWDSVAQEFI